MLVNPLAGSGRRRDLVPRVLRRLGAAGPVRVLDAADSAAAERACHAAVERGARAVVAVGGDGTVHRALQAVAGRPVGFGVVPAGTGNDFASGAGMPGDPLTCAARIAAALREDRRHPLDLALIEAGGPQRSASPRWFGAVLAAGFDAQVNERANRLRRPRGPRRYDLAIALELARLRPRRYALEVDGADCSFDGVLAAVGNCPSYGGGMRVVPDADPADGLLDVVVAASLGRAALVAMKPRLRRGTHVHDPRVTTYRARQVRLHAEGVVGYADGERIGPLPMTVRCVAGALRLLR
ncbi:hypothetical protein GCM10012284_43370 [Mangrovihabitans endophyticus]|uniref:DAGKc domain-containing protein n=1 Tax=Mangrovihabitans endophyticus TaxID=1751298 RepID=A0A8J3C155_9ACTN|nr:hypothetical protein GCM10012284_43370 [Mangrovihabitans endophyticus]